MYMYTLLYSDIEKTTTSRGKSFAATHQEQAIELEQMTVVNGQYSLVQSEERTELTGQYSLVQAEPNQTTVTQTEPQQTTVTQTETTGQYSTSLRPVMNIIILHILRRESTVPSINCMNSYNGGMYTIGFLIASQSMTNVPVFSFCLCILCVYNIPLLLTG